MNQQLVDFSKVMPLVVATGVLASICTIQSPSQTASASGQPNLGVWTNVSGLVNLPCMFAPLLPDSARTMIQDEIKNMEYTEEMTVFHVLLNGYYPQVLQVYRAVIDGNPYDILGVESDSQKQMTRLAVRKREL